MQTDRLISVMMTYHSNKINEIKAKIIKGGTQSWQVDQEEADVVKVCYFTANGITHIDYKDTELLKRFISERGKIYHVV